MNGDQRPSRLKIDEDHLHHRHRHDLEKKLDDKSLFGIGPLKLETTEKFDVEDVTFTLGTSGSCRLQVFNSMDDRDDEGILGTPRSEKTADQTVDSGLEALDFEPFICFDRDNAWIKYSLDGKARASAKTGVLTDITNFQLKAGHALSFDWYRKHNPSEQLGHAIRDDAGRFKFIVNQDDIEHLDENEALTMTVSGELKGVLDAQLSGILPSFFGKLSKLELFPGKLPIKIDTKLPVAAFSWSLKDDFVIVISKAGPNKYRLGLKKSRSHQKSGDLFLGFQVKTAPSGALTHLLKHLDKAFFGAPQEELQTIIKKCPPEKTIAQAATSCDESERHVLSMTADRLDLDENTNTLADIADWLKKNGHKIKPTVEHLLNHTVKFGLDYGYNRTETNTLFFETEVDDTVLESYHKELIRSKFDNFMEACRDKHDGITVKRFIKEKALEITNNRGFVLGVDDWAIGGRETEKLRRVQRENLDRTGRIYILGARGYEDYLGEKKIQFDCNFNAEMKRVSRHKLSECKPAANEFDFDLSLACVWENPSGDDLEAIFDHAALWRACDVEGLEESAPQLENKPIKKATCLLKLNAPGFRALLPYLCVPDHNRLIASLSAAMPWNTYRGRRELETRRHTYRGLWQYIRQQGLNRLTKNEHEWARVAGGVLRGDYPKLANYEKNRYSAQRTTSFAGIAFNQDPFRDLNRFCDGAAMLYNALNDPNRDYRVIEESWAKLKTLMDVGFYVRVLGDYLLALSENHREIMNEVESTLAITYQDGNDECLLNMTK